MTTERVRDRIVDLRRVPASSLQPNPKNWRTHPKAQQNALRGLLADIGYADALIARELPDGSHMLIDGHLRAETSGEDIVPVLVVDLDDAEADKLLLTLDPLAAMAETNKDRLEALLRAAGGGDPAVEAMLAALAQKAHILMPGEGLTDPDDVPEAPEPVTKPGDLWLLGEHRLLCGDATNADDVARLLDGAVPFMCVTDPPYGVEYDPAWRNVAAAEGYLAYSARRVGVVTNDDRADWREAWELFPGDVLYSWHPAGATSLIHAAAIESAGFDLRMQIIWAKSNFPISRGDYHVRHEPCWYAVRHGQPAQRTGDRTQTTVWDFKKTPSHKELLGMYQEWKTASTVWEISLDKNVDGGHSTQKPIECMERAIRNHYAAEVYDPFLGSGTTLIACERLGRRCFAMEIEPRYVDVAVKRWQQFTGREAILDGRP